uniref:Uncharacterized protein n=1 Tax=Rhizophora mucronata TaxID=61149 RepID=A0A2P2NLG7_RHIMU
MCPYLILIDSQEHPSLKSLVPQLFILKLVLKFFCLVRKFLYIKEMVLLKSNININIHLYQLEIL